MRCLLALAILMSSSGALIELQAHGKPKLPSRESAVVIPLLRAFTAANTYADVVVILGKPELNSGSAGPDAIFALTDGSHINVRAFGSKIRDITLHPPQRAVISGRGEFLYRGKTSNWPNGS